MPVSDQACPAKSLQRAVQEFGLERPDSLQSVLRFLCGDRSALTSEGRSFIQRTMPVFLDERVDGVRFLAPLAAVSEMRRVLRESHG